jgi:soluble lytic murein transglycosylase-like protein
MAVREPNISMRFCFKLGAMAGLTALALCAAEPPVAQSPAPRRITTVVRPDLRTGKLVRSVIVTPMPAAERTATAKVATPAADPAAPGIDRAVERIAAEHALSPELIHSVIKVESNYNPYAVSSKGALGLMQLIPSTARRFGVSDVFDPVENIQGGARYLSYLLGLFRGDYSLALAAYNAGESAVARYGGVPPYPETRNYVQSVSRRMQEARKAAPAEPRKTEKKEDRPVEAQPAGPNHIREIVESDGRVRYVSQ